MKCRISVQSKRQHAAFGAITILRYNIDTRFYFKISIEASGMESPPMVVKDAELVSSG